LAGLANFANAVTPSPNPLPLQGGEGFLGLACFSRAGLRCYDPSHAPVARKG